MSFSTALSGLRAASADLDVTSHNIANAGTIGFKASKAAFGDIYASSFEDVVDTAVGRGVLFSDVVQSFSQGNLEFTQNSLDLAISGEGFLVFDSAGSSVYSRAGQMHIDREGYVVNSVNQRLQVYPAVSDTQFNTGVTSDLLISTAEAAPNATTRASTTLNLDAGASNPAVAVFDPTDINSYNSSMSLSLFDSLGEAHTGSVYFMRTGTNAWDARLVVDGDTAQTPGTVSFTFNADGTPNTIVPNPANFGTFTPGNGASPIDVDFDFGQVSQFASSFQVSAIAQDGFTSGRLTGIDVDESGIVFARFSNGQTNALGQVVIADFSNPQGLRNLGDSSWGQTFAAGEPVFGTAGSGTFGGLQSGALEQSNVDLSGELVNLITAQRNFQANAQAISANDTITQTIINIR